MASDNSEEHRGKTITPESQASARPMRTIDTSDVPAKLPCKSAAEIPPPPPGDRKADMNSADHESQGSISQERTGDLKTALARLSAGPYSSFEIYKEYDVAWRHEDNLISQRLTWFLTMQAFSFAACAAAASKCLEFDLITKGAGTFKFRVLGLFILTISAVNIYLSRRVLESVEDAFKYIGQLSAEVQLLFSKQPFPRVGHDWNEVRQEKTWGVVSSLPTVLKYVWIAILVGTVVIWFWPQFVSCILSGSLTDVLTCRLPLLP